MNKPLQLLEEDLGALRAAWIGALPAFGSADTRGTADAMQTSPTQDYTAQDVRRMSDAGLLRTVDAAARLVRAADATLARLAGEVARRSPAELGKGGLAKQQGFLNATRLVAAATGGGLPAAARLVSVGKATAARLSLTGQLLPAAHPHVAEALEAGAASIDAAWAITTMLDRVAVRADPMQADGMEEVLAERAADLPLDLLCRMVAEAETRLDQDGIAPREEALRAGRCLHIREDGHGMVHLRACLDPETAAPVKAAIEAIVTNTIRTRRTENGCNDSGGASDAPVIADDRSIPQLQADALAMIARHVLGCTRMPAAPAMAVVVRCDLETLTRGVGFGRIDGLDQPVSAGTIRKMAATAGIIPAVLGTDSVPLDLGRAARLFSWGQRLALGERDDGCACCGLAVAYVEAHHIRWWERDTGPTDLNNGVLLCGGCHTRVHTDGWQIRVDADDDNDDAGRVWFIPPAHVDPDQTPRLGGKARYALPRHSAA